MRPLGRIVGSAAAAAVLAGCAGLAPESFDGSRPAFAPERFFAGRTRSSGVFETPGGAPSSRFAGETSGRRDPDGATSFDQVIRFDDGTVRRRRWRLVRLDAHRVEATGSDVVGIARGQLYGRALHLAYTVRTDPANPLVDVDFEQWLYLGDDGRTLTNRSIIRKFGVTIRQATEQFRRG